MAELILESLLSVLSALAGGLFIYHLKLDHHRLCMLISFSAGGLMAAALGSLFPTAFKSIGIIELLISAGTGYLLLWGISHYYYHVCPACSASHFDEQATKKFSEIVLLLFTALSFHCFLDGIALISDKIGDAHQHSVFFALIAHKFPEGVALASLMAGANYPKNKIFQFVFLVEMTTLVGAFVGHFLLKEQVSMMVIGYIQAHLGGGFIFLSLHAILGEIWKNHKKLVTVSFATGFIVIYLISQF